MCSKESIKKEIAAILMKNKEPITISKLAEEVNSSEKSIRNYLKELDAEFTDEGIHLVKKPNVGVYLDISDEKREKLASDVYGSEAKKSNYSFEFRKKYILRTLFKNRGTYTIQLFADELYCSKSTIVNDLIYVEKWIEDRGLILKRKQNQGLWIEGNEEAFRKAMMDVFFEINDGDGCEKFEESETNTLDYRIDLSNYKKIKQLFPRADLIKIQSILQEAEKKLGDFFTDDAFINLVIHIVIAIERVKNKNNINPNEEITLVEKNKEKEYGVAKWIVQRLSEEFGLNFPHSEVGYLALHILGSKIQEVVTSEEYDGLMEEQDSEYVEIAKEMVELISEILKVDLTNDKLLLLALVLHLKPTVAKLRYGFKLRNPLLERIKKEYTSIFSSVWACSGIFEKHIGFSITEDEVGYIALHIAVAIQRLNNKIKVIVVCPSGVGTSQLVAARLEKELDEIEVVSVLPVNKLTEELINKVDLIICTINIQKSSDKFVCVSTLIDRSDILKIRKSISKIKSYVPSSNVNQETSSIPPSHIFDEELCFIESNMTDFMEIVQYYSSLMEQKGYVKDGFSKDVLQREKRMSTYIGNGIAIPHGIQDLVKEPKICIVKLDKPILWKDAAIKIILILAIKFDGIAETKNFFKKFYSVVNSNEAITKITNTENKKKIINIFLNGESD